MLFKKSKKYDNAQKLGIAKIYKVEEIYVVTTKIISNYNDKSREGPKSVTMYFLAKYENEEYYELFSDKKFEKEKEQDENISSYDFNTPYITKVENLSKYLKDKNKVTIDGNLLFDFITNMNVLNKLGVFSNK